MREQAEWDAIIVGAGFSGICAAIRLKQIGLKRVRILEKSHGIGGTWWENTYPGATCDVPSHFYCYSFAPNPAWSRLYSPQAEIQRYLESVADRFDVRGDIEQGADVASLHFDAEGGFWTIVLRSGEQYRARFVINATGGLHVPRTPALDGATQFRGVQMHTAEWARDFDAAGKRIAVIGSAASAIQAVPQLAKTAAHVAVFQRTPNYIAPRNDFAYGPVRKWIFSKLPWINKIYRALIFLTMEKFIYPIIVNDRYRQKRAARLIAHMRSVVKNKDYHQAVTPDYELGCKRILISDDYLQTLNRDNVTLLTEPITGITETGIQTADGAHHDCDAIVYATGFDIQKQFFHLDIAGEGGLSLRDAWKDKAEAYRGVMVPGFPNYFTVTGPNTGVGTTSVIFMIEQTVDWIARCIRHAGEEASVSVRRDATARYNQTIHAALAGTVWVSGCESWYRNPNGRIETLYPHNGARFRKLMQDFAPNDLILHHPQSNQAN